MMYRNANRVMFQRITRGKLPSMHTSAKRGNSSSNNGKVDQATKNALFGKQQPKLRQQLNRTSVVTQVGGALSQTVMLDLLLFGAVDDDGT